MVRKFEIEEGVIYNLFYMGLSVQGYYFRGNWILFGLFAVLIKKLKIHPDGYFLIAYNCNYFKVLYLFLKGEFISKE
ncbi:hypothetical protein [Leptospira alstonii]|uniref:Uncharacterized protein n=1 Tax=Leptospira alstonii serovar Sichuan str. 79601 TaxID=1218565 RepID=M6D2K5_9LEPT|nr:hypothetical protein [Leptospira alstonii]AGS80504.1 hypothetical protein LEP1GSC193_0739 [Leptospira phage vB_LalZ_80412-LE1]EMJ95413.1 hypothetical protein LEP1GSC194_3539 [Leptospira alstonii serovar Sichuan str. 79601]